MSNNILETVGSHTFKFTTVTGGITAGTLQIVGNTPMIPLESATGAGTVVTCQVGGSAILPKKAAASTSWAAGGRVYYMTTGGVNKLTGVAAAAKLIGYGIEAAATGATSGRVRLITGPLVNEAAT